MSTRPRPVARSFALALVLGAAGCHTAPPAGLDGIDRHVIQAEGDGPRVLAVTAHPDDEIAFAATLYKTATHLRGTCDLFVITDGDAGFKYSTLAERHYAQALTDPAVGRRSLPTIRRRELIAGCDVLGLRQIFFLHQRDPRYTKDPAEVLAAGDAGWDVPLLRRRLDAVLRAGRYDFVVTHLPVPETHGHHKAATVLALEAIAALPEGQRPVALGSFGFARGAPAVEFPPALEGFPITAIRTDVPPLRFDRTQKFGFKDSLDYHIVVNWAIAAHRSQGTMQTLMGRFDAEQFRVYALGPAEPADAARRAQAWFERLREPQFTAREYPE